MHFHIDTMTCSGCVRGVTRVIQSADPQAQVEADPSTHSVEVESTAPVEALVAALAAAGFAPR